MKQCSPYLEGAFFAKFSILDTITRAFVASALS